MAIIRAKVESIDLTWKGRMAVGVIQGEFHTINDFAAFVMSVLPF